MSASTSTATPPNPTGPARYRKKASRPGVVEGSTESPTSKNIDTTRRQSESPPSGSILWTETILHGLLEICRTITGIIVLSATLSWFVTGGDSLFWGWKGAHWARGMAGMRIWWVGPITLTPTELSLFDGTDESIPLYVGFNGSVFDVSQARVTYGPGGPYHHFAGKDATRAFITGCFKEDQTHDIRGVEEMFMPVYEVVDRIEVTVDADGNDGADVGGHGRTGPVGPKDHAHGDKSQNHKKEDSQKKKKKEHIKYEDEIDVQADRAAALEIVDGMIRHWSALLGGQKADKPYFRIGSIERDEIDEKVPRLTLCKDAQKSIPTVKVMRRLKE